MIQSIFVVLGLLHFTDAMFNKFDVWGRIVKAGMKFKWKWMFQLTVCRFCMMFHFGWIITLIYGIFNGFELNLIFVPFIVSGFNKLIDQRNDI